MSKTTTPDLANLRKNLLWLKQRHECGLLSDNPSDDPRVDSILGNGFALLDAYAEQGRKLEAAEVDRKNEGVARFCDAETIAELMENGARTWMPIGSAQPVKNGSIIVMTSDDEPVIGEAFWHEHGEGVWALHWQACSPKDEPWNDPISETNKPIIAWQPMPEGVPAARIEQLSTAKEATSSLMVDLEKAREANADQAATIAALTAEVERLKVEVNRSWLEWFRAVDHLRGFAESDSEGVTTETMAIFYIADQARHSGEIPDVLTTQGEG